MSLYGIGRGRLGGREEGSGVEEHILGSRNSRRRSKGPGCCVVRPNASG